MASSGSKSVAVTSWNTLKFSWSEKEQSIADNTTTINWKMELIAGSSGRISSTTSKKWTVIVNGKTYSGTNTVGIASNTTKTLASGSTVISHTSDGTKTFSYSFSQQFSITFSGTSIGTKSGSGNGTLDTIPRASTLAASNGTLGKAQTLTVDRKYSGFTHTITYKCGSASGTIASKSSNEEISWTPPLSLASQNTAGTSVSIALTITTYNGTSSIGSSTRTISCSIPSSVKPTVSVSSSDPTGYKGTYGDYIQKMSKFKIDVTASGSYGSKIESYKITADGKTYKAESVTTGVISGSGSLKINVSVTDSRGRTASTSVTVSVLPYSKPKISSLSAYRCDADGNSNSSGAYLGIKFSATVTALNSKNTADYSIKYKKSSESTYTTETLTDYSGQYSVSGGVFVFPADTSSSYDITLTVTDAFGSVPKSATGPSIKKLFSLLKHGLGFAFGKVAELEGFLDIAFKTLFRDDISIITNKKFFGTKPDGSLTDAFNACNQNGNTVIGYGNYTAENGNTHVYGYDVYIGVSNTDDPGLFKPYYSKGDSVSLTVRTAGYVTSSKTTVYFLIPLSKPVIGSPKVTLTDGNGFILRHNNVYTHGSSSSIYVKPTRYTAEVTESGINVSAVFDDTTNVTNNDAIGITWNGTITFS